MKSRPSKEGLAALRNMPEIARNCEECGTPFIPRRSQIAKGNGRFCSKRCINVKTRSTMSHGYVMVSNPLHPRANCRGYVMEHILVAEMALGRPLTAKHPIHHFNEIKSDNRGANLVICEDVAYHKLLHVRQRIADAGGNPNTEKLCTRCKNLRLRTQFRQSNHFYDGLYNECMPCCAVLNRRPRKRTA